MHKWAGKAKFARTGGEANAIAIQELLKNDMVAWVSWL